jgi:hypothetical protein
VTIGRTNKKEWEKGVKEIKIKRDKAEKNKLFYRSSPMGYTLVVINIIGQYCDMHAVGQQWKRCL